MKVLLTGSSGLIGAALSAALTRVGVEVVPFDLRHDGSDIRDRERVGAAMAGCDGIVHLAAISRVAWGEADPDLCAAVNIDGAANVIEAALGMANRPWFILASSREVYGQLESLPATETAPLRPLNVYGRSKLAGEELVAAARQRGLRAAIVRLSNVHGGMQDHPDRAVPSLLWRAIAGQEMRISGAGTFFDFVHVDDCVAGLVEVARRLQDGAHLPPLHLVTGVATSLGQLAAAVVEVAHSVSELTVLPARSFDVPGFVGSPDLAEKTIGWAARIPLRQGLVRLRDELLCRNAPLVAVVMPPRTGPATLASRRELEAWRQTSYAEAPI